MSVCKDVISLIKKQIKSKTVPPPAKLRALKLLHACMMTGNNEFLLFASKKVMQRFTVFARYKKQSQDENRGSDIFGSQSTSSTENMQASAEFLKCLLTYLKTWAQQFGVGPDGQPSSFLKAYRALEGEGVRFPDAENKGRRSSQPPPKPSVSVDDDAGFLEDLRPRANLSRPRNEVRASSDLSKKSMKKDAEAIQSSVSLMKEMLSTSEPDRETLDVLAATLSSHVVQLEAQIGSLAALPHQDTEIQTLLEANDSVREALEQYERFKTKGSSAPQKPRPRQEPRAEPKPDAGSLLDLNFDAPQQRNGAAAFQTEARAQPSYPLAPNNPFLSVRPAAAQQWSDPNSAFGSMRPAVPFDSSASVVSPRPVDPELAAAKLEVAKLQELRLQHQSDIERLQKKYEARLADAESRRNAEDPRMRAMVENLQAAGLQKDAEIARLRGLVEELTLENRRLTEELGRSQPASRLQAPAAEVFVTNSSNSSSNSPFNSQTGASPQSYPDLPLPRRSIDMLRPALEVPEPLSNAAELKAVWFAERGKLFDSATIQVGFKILVQGIEARAMLYVGNKSPGDIEKLVTTVVSGAGLEALIDKEDEGAAVPERGKADRQLRFKATGYFDQPPKLAVRYVKDQREVRCLLLLPLTVLRFLSSPKADPSQVVHIWNTLEPSASVTRFRAISAAVGSMALLAEALTTGDCFQVVTRREAPELEPGALLACGRKESAILFLKIRVEPGVGGTLEIRCNNPRLRECVLAVLPSLLIDAP